MREQLLVRSRTLRSTPGDEECEEQQHDRGQRLAEGLAQADVGDDRAHHENRHACRGERHEDRCDAGERGQDKPERREELERADELDEPGGEVRGVAQSGSAGLVGTLGGEE